MATSDPLLLRLERVPPTDLVSATARAFADEIAHAIGADACIVRIDCRGLRYLDGAGVGQLKRLARLCDEAGGFVLLDGLSEDYDTLLEIDAIDTRLFVRRPVPLRVIDGGAPR